MNKKNFEEQLVFQGISELHEVEEYLWNENKISKEAHEKYLGVKKIYDKAFSEMIYVGNILVKASKDKKVPDFNSLPLKAKKIILKLNPGLVSHNYNPETTARIILTTVDAELRCLRFATTRMALVHKYLADENEEFALHFIEFENKIQNPRWD